MPTWTAIASSPTVRPHPYNTHARTHARTRARTRTHTDGERGPAVSGFSSHTHTHAHTHTHTHTHTYTGGDSERAQRSAAFRATPRGASDPLQSANLSPPHPPHPPRAQGAYKRHPVMCAAVTAGRRLGASAILSESVLSRSERDPAGTFCQWSERDPIGAFLEQARSCLAFWSANPQA